MKGIVIQFSVIVCVLCLVAGRTFIDRNLSVYVLDVGQGDSILIRTPRGRYILVDGGPGDYVLRELGRVMPPWVRTIDVVVLTHPHADHLEGLNDVLDRYLVRQIWWNPVSYESTDFDLFTEKVKECYKEGVVVYAVTDRDAFTIDGVQFDVVWPDAKSKNNSSTEGFPDGDIVFCDMFDGNVNNDSVVMLLSYGTFDMLLTGDAELEVEEQYVRRLKGRDIEVLKAGHHCSKTASGELLLRTVSAETAICSCGKDNSFGHPHGEALERFDIHRITWYRTDELGAINIVSDGISWNMK